MVTEVPPKAMASLALLIMLTLVAPSGRLAQAEGLPLMAEGSYGGLTTRALTVPHRLSVIGFYALGDARTSSWTDLFGLPFPLTARGNTDIVRELAFGWYTIDAAGALLTRSPRNAWQRPAAWQYIIGAAEYYNLRTEMVVHETNRGDLLTTFLADDTAMEHAVVAIAAAASRYGGVNLNFEGLGFLARGEEAQAIRDSFTHFVARLAPVLRAANRTLTLTLHPPNSVYRGYDFAALGKLADRIIIMAHDYGESPEPLDRVIQAVEMALVDVPREKLILGLSVYTETALSLVDKLVVAERFRLQGVSFWRLGLLVDEMWRTLRQVLPAPTNGPSAFVGLDYLAPPVCTLYYVYRKR